MNELAGSLPRSVVTVDDGLEIEFEARIADSSKLAFRVAYSVLRQREDAEEVAQDALTKAYRSFRQLRDRERFQAWLVRMTWRLAIDRLRSDKRRVAREQAVALPDITPAAIDDPGRERARLLWRAVDELPEKLRLVVVLSAMEGHDLRDVARLVGAPEGTVKSRLFQARKRLQEILR